MGGNVASRQHCVELYLSKRHLLHMIGFMPVLYSPARPLDSPPLSPPPVFTVESHTEQIGTEQSSEAEETWSHRSGNWTLLPLSVLSHPSFSLHPSLHLLCSSPPSPQLSNIPSAQGEWLRPQCNSAARDGAERA